MVGLGCVEFIGVLIMLVCVGLFYCFFYVIIWMLVNSVVNGICVVDVGDLDGEVFCVEYVLYVNVL